MTRNGKLRFDSQVMFHELDHLIGDAELGEAITVCVAAQKHASAATLQTTFHAPPDAKRAVSEDALAALLQAGENVNGIRTNRDISNVVVFNDTGYTNSVVSEELAKRRRAVDLLVAKRMEQLFETRDQVAVLSSGFFLYPPGGYMGWHTNANTPGWRLYINYAEEPGKSFFRYRDPNTGRVVTSIDKPLNFRLFRVSAEEPLWHAIYSDTNRYSLGYRVTTRPGPSVPQRVVRRLKRIFAA